MYILAFLSNISNSNYNFSENKLLTRISIFVALVISFIFVFNGDSVTKFPVFITDSFTFTAWVNHGEDYLKEHYRWITKLIASYIKASYYALEDFLLDSSWLFIVALLVIPSVAFGGLRLAL